MTGTGRAAPCPVCGKPGVARYRPFCSGRCADVDLNRWLSGRYAIPVVEEDGASPDATESAAETAAKTSGQAPDETL